MNEHDTTQQAAARICAAMCAVSPEQWHPPIYPEHLTPAKEGAYYIDPDNGQVYRGATEKQVERMALKPSVTWEQRIVDYSARTAVMLVAAVQRELNRKTSS